MSWGPGSRERCLCRRLLQDQDAVILAERLLAWTDDALSRDLAAYDDVSVDDARQSRDRLLQWLKQGGSRGGGE